MTTPPAPSDDRPSPPTEQLIAAIADVPRLLRPAPRLQPARSPLRRPHRGRLPTRRLPRPDPAPPGLLGSRPCPSPRRRGRSPTVPRPRTGAPVLMSDLRSRLLTIDSAVPNDTAKRANERPLGRPPSGAPTQQSPPPLRTPPASTDDPYRTGRPARLHRRSPGPRPAQPATRSDVVSGPRPAEQSPITDQPAYQFTIRDTPPRATPVLIVGAWWFSLPLALAIVAAVLMATDTGDPTAMLARVFGLHVIASVWVGTLPARRQHRRENQVTAVASADLMAGDRAARRAAEGAGPRAGTRTPHSPTPLRTTKPGAGLGNGETRLPHDRKDTV